MKQIERYYDVEVEFRDEVPYQFVAKISRDVNVSAFLEKLELTNLIHFKIEGKKTSKFLASFFAQTITEIGILFGVII